MPKGLPGTSNPAYLHGQACKGNVSPTYRTWASIWYRCTNKKNKDYPSYGGRGITVCDRWREFSFFLKDMGERPPNMSIDRIDNDGHYEPSNCRWADAITQGSNTRRVKRLSFDGKTLTMKEWADITGVNYACLRSRILLGWTVEMALCTPIMTPSKVAELANTARWSDAK